MQHNFTRRSISLLLCVIFFMTFCSGSPAFSAEAQSKSIKLATYTGDVTVKKGSKALSSLKEGMRIFDGYSVITGPDSYAFLELDDSKFVKMDQNSDLKIKKNGKKNDLLLNSGALFFNITKPLSADESLKVKTSNMTMGVRGTTGSVITRPIYESNGQVKNLTVEVQIYTGAGYVTWKNETTQEQGAQVLQPGESIKMSVDTLTGTVVTTKAQIGADGQSIPTVALAELVTLPEILAQIKASTTIDVEKLPSTLASNKAAEAEQIQHNQETVKKMQEDFKKANQSEGEYGETTDTTDPNSPETPPTDSGGGSNNGGGSGGGDNGGGSNTPDFTIKIGERSYSSLAEAFQAVKDNQATKIEVSGEIKLPKGLEVEKDKEITINAAQQTTITGLSNHSQSLFTIEEEGTLNLTGKLTLDGSKKHNLINVQEDGSLTMADEVVLSNGKADKGGAIYSEGNVAISGGTIRGNEAKHGAGIYQEKGTLTISAMEMVENKATGNGGGIYQEQGILTISAGKIEKNEAKHGGGVYQEKGTLIISAVEVVENKATGNGGGIYLKKGTLTIPAGKIEKNTAKNGGGIFQEQGSLTISGGEIKSNEATKQGGGIANIGKLAITGGTILENTAEQGGGIYNEGSLTISDGITLPDESENDSESPGLPEEGSVIKLNTATYGGGIYNAAIGNDDEDRDDEDDDRDDDESNSNDGSGKTGTLCIYAGTIEENTAKQGGGIYNEAVISSAHGLLGEGEIEPASVAGNYFIGTMTIYGGTIGKNTATENGGGVYNLGSIALSGGAIKENVATKNGGGVYNRGDVDMVSATDSPEGRGVGSIIESNSATNGGGIYNNGRLRVEIGTFTANQVTEEGANIYVVRSSEYTNNTVPKIGGVYDELNPDRQMDLPSEI